MVYSLLRVYTLANCYMKRRSVYVVQADAVTMVSEGIYIYTMTVLVALVIGYAIFMYVHGILSSKGG